MNGYKKIIKNKKTRYKILKMLKTIPDKSMIKLQYRIKLHRGLNLKNPQRYTEKIQWYKLNYRNPLMQKCVDKYYVREYVKEKGLENILNTLYQVVDCAQDLDFNLLPNKFIIKTTNGSGTNIICRNKSSLDINAVKKELDEYLAQAEASAGREWAYEGSSKKIIVEALLEDLNNVDLGVSDYKFLCFNGKPKYIVYDKDRFTDHKRNFYDIDWNYIKVDSDCPCFGDTVDKPKGLEEMLEIAKKLSEDFPAVRVDLYNIDGKIFFGELTFYPWSGYVQFSPDSFDYELGKDFPLIKS